MDSCSYLLAINCASHNSFHKVCLSCSQAQGSKLICLQRIHMKRCKTQGLGKGTQDFSEPAALKNCTFLLTSILDSVLYAISLQLNNNRLDGETKDGLCALVVFAFLQNSFSRWWGRTPIYIITQAYIPIILVLLGLVLLFVFWVGFQDISYSIAQADTNLLQHCICWGYSMNTHPQQILWFCYVQSQYRKL